MYGKYNDIEHSIYLYNPISVFLLFSLLEEILDPSGVMARGWGRLGS
jgi:hypothetical protein